MKRVIDKLCRGCQNHFMPVHIDICPFADCLGIVVSRVTVQTVLRLFLKDSVNISGAISLTMNSV